MSTIFIDRRKNPQDKNLLNKQRFFKRIKKYINQTLKESFKNKKIEDIGIDEKVKIPIKDIEEFQFEHDYSSGKKNFVFSGNDRFKEGDLIEKPTGGVGSNGGSKGSDQGGGEDSFVFVLNRDEFLEYFFEDLELPNLVKKDLKIIETYKLQREGYSNYGSITNLDIFKSFKTSLKRRISLNRPSEEELEQLRKEIEDEEKKIERNEEKIKYLKKLLIEKEEKIKQIPFFDDIDLKYRRYEQKPIYISSAVMFCLMDVSGSMTELKKEFAKKFFFLLYLFLQKRYKKIELVFIRHTETAKEVSEDEFFNSKETGGTVVSSALELTKDIINKRYDPSNWCIYIAQASDGDNFEDDNPKVEMLIENILGYVQYYSYIQVDPDEERAISMFSNMQKYSVRNNLFNIMDKLSKKYENLKCNFIYNKKQIWEVFADLFSKK